MRENILRILADTLGLSAAELGPDPAMETLPAWDSVAHLNFVMSLEQEYRVQFTPEEMMALGSASAVESALAQKGVR